MLSCIADSTCALNALNCGRAETEGRVHAVPRSDCADRAAAFQSVRHRGSLLPALVRLDATRKPASCSTTSSRRPMRMPVPAAASTSWAAMLFIERPAGLAPEELAAPGPGPRSRGRLPEADHPHHPLLRPARPRRGRRPAAMTRVLAAIGYRAGCESAAPAVGGGPGRSFLPCPRPRAGRHPRRAEQRRPLAGGRAHPEGARSLHRRSHGLRRSRPPQARRVRARPVLRGAGDGHRHRSGPPHVRGAQRQGQAARAQRHPEGGAARAACRPHRRQPPRRSGKRPKLAPASHFEQLFSHIRAMYRRPDDKVISDIRQIAAEKGGAWAFIERILQPSAAILDDILNARHAGHPQSRQDRPVSALPRLAFVLRLAAAGMLWWLERGRGRGRARALLAPARSPGLRREDTGHRRLEARAAGSAWSPRPLPTAATSKARAIRSS